MEENISNEKIEKEEIVKQSNELKQILNAIQELSSGDKEDIDALLSLLSLKDKEFSAIAPLILNDLIKTYNNPNTQIFLMSCLMDSGLTYEDFLEEYKEIFDLIDSNISDEELSKEKKDFLKQVISLLLNSLSENYLLPHRSVEIPIDCNEDYIPSYAHITDAAVDIYAIEDYTINPGEQVLIHTGIKTAIPNGYALLIQPRSGLSTKSKLRIPNTPGLIDSGYRGEICVPMENIEPRIKDLVIDDNGKATGILYGSSYNIEKGERIAQARLVEVPTISWIKVSNILEFDSDRGEGGFGSTGTK